MLRLYPCYQVTVLGKLNLNHDKKVIKNLHGVIHGVVEVVDEGGEVTVMVTASLRGCHHHGHDDDDGLPAYSHHDKIPPWWGNVSNDKGGNVSVSNYHHTLQLKQLALVSCSTRPQC